MSISLRQEFHIPRSRQFLKAIDHFRSINLHLLQRYAGNRERYLKPHSGNHRNSNGRYLYRRSDIFLNGTADVFENKSRSFS